MSNPFQYAGQYTDSESGLQYLRARYYDPSTQQFLTVDPLVGMTGARYSYADTNPLNESDPRGSCVFCVVIGAFLVGGGTSWVGAELITHAETGQWLDGRQSLAAFTAGGVAGVSALFGGETIGGTLIASAVGGAVGQCVANVIDPAHAGSVVTAAIWGTVGGAIGTHFYTPGAERVNVDPWWFFKTRKSQMDPKTWRKWIQAKHARFRGFWGAAVTGGAVGSGSVLGWP